MKKKNLNLSKQTVANLSGLDQEQVMGGVFTVHNSVCLPTCKGETCYGPHCDSIIPACTEPSPTFPGWPRCK